MFAEVVIAVCILLPLAVAASATFISGYLYGQVKLLNKLVADAKRRERRQTNELRTLHSKFSERAGFGPLFRKVEPEKEQQLPRRRVTPPSQTIADLKNEHNGVPKFKESVPVGIGREFLSNFGNGSESNGENNHG